MKKVLNVKDSWYIQQLEPVDKLDESMLQRLTEGECVDGSDWLESSMPAQVHEILLKYGRIEDPVKALSAEGCIWVSNIDWIYKHVFKSPVHDDKVFVNFKGLDTLVDVYINGKHVAYHNDMFIPLRIEITDYLKDVNVFILHFHSPIKFIENINMPDKWKGKIQPRQFLRKATHDVCDFNGPKPYLAHVGIYDDVYIEFIDKIEISSFDIRYDLSYGYENALLNVTVAGEGYKDGAFLKVEVKDSHREIIKECIKKIGCRQENAWEENIEFGINDIKLWWPRGYGNQPLYEVAVSVLDDGLICDSISKNIGFRDIKMISPFNYLINNKKVKLWGGNLTPIDGMTHCWNRERTLKVLDLAENCNFNTLRVWGGGEPYSEELYDEADKRGLLLWFEFYHRWTMYPDSEEFRTLCKSECEHLVGKLKHHPSILFWCGGNEQYLGAEIEMPGEEYIGGVIFEKDYKEICKRLDPGRDYYISSPYGGSFVNDPLVGDTHGYTHLWFVPGADYPIMLSENTRISIPVLKSMKKFFGEQLWPEGFNSMVKRYGDCPMPDNWLKIAGDGLFKRIKNIEKFYDADTKESLIYKFGMARAYHLRETVERSRRGRPSAEPEGERRCMGHYVWKFNDSWPQVYCSMIDYNLEPYIPYYTLKRAHAPVMLSFDIQDFIYLWVVNDSPRYVEGTVVFKLFNPIESRVLKEIRKDAVVPAEESKVIMNLNELGQFKRENILYACFIDKHGDLIARTNDFVDIERNLYFPDAKLDINVEEGTLTIEADKFARCVELTGNDNGDEFGWVFEDNYFDLLPGEVKKVKIMGGHRKGTVTAKAYYSDYTTNAEFNME